MPYDVTVKSLFIYRIRCKFWIRIVYESRKRVCGSDKPIAIEDVTSPETRPRSDTLTHSTVNGYTNLTYETIANYNENTNSKLLLICIGFRFHYFEKQANEMVNWILIQFKCINVTRKWLYDIEYFWIFYLGPRNSFILSQGNEFCLLTLKFNIRCRSLNRFHKYNTESHKEQLDLTFSTVQKLLQSQRLYLRRTTQDTNKKQIITFTITLLHHKLSSAYSGDFITFRYALHTYTLHTHFTQCDKFLSFM